MTTLFRYLNWLACTCFPIEAFSVKGKKTLRNRKLIQTCNQQVLFQKGGSHKRIKSTHMRNICLQLSQDQT